MAGTIYKSPSRSPNSVPFLQTKHPSRVFIIKPAKISLNRTFKLQITSIKNNLVFEDLSRVSMLKPANISLNRTFKLQYTSSIKNNLVFEDRSNGVICYRDDDGEIICEGYDDEEPRIIEQEIENLPCERSWLSFGSDGDLKIYRLLLQQSVEWFEIVNGSSGIGMGSGRGEVRIRANGLSS